MREPTHPPSPQEETFRHRGYIPHFETTRPQFVTIRLHGALPWEVYERIQKLHEHRPLPVKKEKIRGDVERYLDGSHGVAWLRDPRIASVIADSLQREDGRDYELHAWTVMPNHVHVLLSLFDPSSLGSIVRRWKTWTARHANELLGRRGAFWSRDYFDRAMRSPRQMEATQSYIERNPVTAGLCQSPEEWRWGSAADGGRGRRAAVCNGAGGGSGTGRGRGLALRAGPRGPVWASRS